MTTGRINQVTIVRRGWPAGACFSAGEISKLLVWAPGAPPACGGRLVAGRASAGIPLSPSSVPQGLPPPRMPAVGGAGSGAPGGGLTCAASTMTASAARGYLPLRCLFGLARGQPSTAPIPRGSALARSAFPLSQRP